MASGQSPRRPHHHRTPFLYPVNASPKSPPSRAASHGHRTTIGHLHACLRSAGRHTPIEGPSLSFSPLPTVPHATSSIGKDSLLRPINDDTRRTVRGTWHQALKTALATLVRCRDTCVGATAPESFHVQGLASGYQNGNGRRSSSKPECLCPRIGWHDLGTRLPAP